MITFRTEVALPKVTKQLSYRQNFLMIGSCFTENIGNNLQNLCFPILTNPCGILYNPASIARCINFLVSKKQLGDSDLFPENGLWNNFSFHSRFSHADKASALAGMNNSISSAGDQLNSASHLFITFGTSWVYRDKEDGSIVGNCHKLPSGRFTRERLSVDEMVREWTELLELLFEVHPQLTIVLTVSPIRHLKDGSYENQVSKSGLFLLVDQLKSHFEADRIIYFPSFELVMDELRDYRFYASDMLHLSDVATAFVQEKFNEIFLDKESKEISSEVGKIVSALSHRPFQSQSSAYQELLSRQYDNVEKISALYPFLNLENLVIDIIQKRGL
jgi:hypothetical protein